MKIRVAWFERYFYFFFIAILDPVLVFQNGYLKSSVSLPFFLKLQGDVPAVYGHFDLWEYRSGRTTGTRRDDWVMTSGWFQHGNFRGRTPSRPWNFRVLFFSRGDQIYATADQRKNCRTNTNLLWLSWHLFFRPVWFVSQNFLMAWKAVIILTPFLLQMMGRIWEWYCGHWFSFFNITVSLKMIWQISPLLWFSNLISSGNGSLVWVGGLDI